MSWDYIVFQFTNYPVSDSLIGAELRIDQFRFG